MSVTHAHCHQRLQMCVSLPAANYAAPSIHVVSRGTNSTNGENRGTLEMDSRTSRQLGQGQRQHIIYETRQHSEHSD